MSENGARIIFKSRYLKPYKNKNGNTGKYAAYIATREGCVKMTDSLRKLPATDAQKKMIAEIVKEIPEMKSLMSLYEYEKETTRGKASDFITDVMYRYEDKMKGMEGYARYIATRPMMDQTRNSGLFSNGNKPVDLKAVMAELQEYQGNVWLPIISLRQEDSEALGYDNPVKWHDLIERHLGDFAREYKIPLERLRWIGAFHKAMNAKGQEHDHVHLMLWSIDPKDGNQSRMTGANMKRVLATDIFQQELNAVYSQKSKCRDEIRKRSQEIISDLFSNMRDYPLQKGNLTEQQMQLLAEEMKGMKGRKVYGYLPKECKEIVDGIMNSLPEADPRIKELLEAWADNKDKQVKIYSNGKYILPPLSEIKEFIPVKNIIVREAVSMNRSVERNQENKNAGTRVAMALADICRKRVGKPVVNEKANITNDDHEQLRKIGMSM